MQLNLDVANSPHPMGLEVGWLRTLLSQVAYTPARWLANWTVSPSVMPSGLTKGAALGGQGSANASVPTSAWRLALREEDQRSEDAAKQLEAEEQLAWLASWWRASGKESSGFEQNAGQPGSLPSSDNSESL